MVSKRALLRGLTLNVWLLALASFLADVSSEMILPILPFFLLALPGASQFILGIVDGIADSTVSFVRILSGYHSDRIGRRKVFVSGGYGLSSAVKVAFGFVFTWPQFLVTRVLERAGKGVRDPPRDAILAESTSKELTGKVFGFHRGMDTSGAILGPIITLALLPLLVVGRDIGDACRIIFVLASIPAVAAFAVTLLVREKRRKPRTMKPLVKSVMSPPPKLKYFIAVASLFSLANFSYSFFLLKVQAVTGSFTAAILFYLWFNIVYASSAFATGGLSDRVGRKPVIATGYYLFSMLCALLVFVNDATLLVGLFVIYGLSYAFFEGVQRAFVADLAASELRGTAMGTYHASVGLAKLPASIIAGYLWLAFGSEYTFLFGAVVSFAALLLLLPMREERGRKG